MTAPYVPGPTNQTPPPAAATPVRPQSFWRSQGGIAVITVSACLVVIAVLFLAPMLGPSGDDLDVDLTSCSQDSIGIAHVNLTVKNNSKQTVTAKLGLEYRDGAGARLDTDTAYVRDIAPGDTARTEEITNLNASAGSIRCTLTSVAVS